MVQGDAMPRIHILVANQLELIGQQGLVPPSTRRAPFSHERENLIHVFEIDVLSRNANSLLLVNASMNLM